MSWDEKLFHSALRGIRSLRRRRKGLSPEERSKVELDEAMTRLRVLACALAGSAIEIKEAEGQGGPVGSVLFLPAQMAVAQDRELNLQAYLYRVAYSSTLVRMGVTLPPDLNAIPEAQARFSLEVVPLVREEMLRLYPGLRSIERALLAAEAPGDLIRRTLSGIEQLQSSGGNPLSLIPPFWGLVLPVPLSAGGSSSTEEIPPPFTKESLPSGTERKAKPREKVETVEIPENKEGESPLVHAFEKVMTAEDYFGGRKSLDGSDELEEQLEALQELDLRKVIRTRERADSIFKSDALLEVAAPEIDESSKSEIPLFRYDEWDYRSRSYRKDWCKVFEEAAPQPLPPNQTRRYVTETLARNARQIRELRRRFEEFSTVRRWRSRQPDGPEIDLDAVVERHTTLRGGHSANRWLYLSQRPRDRDYATLVLLDSSLSTDSWIGNRRVLDVMKESILVLGEVISEFQDRVSIGAFFSNTRNDCRYINVKTFQEPWARCQGKLVALKPTGYTRIGPAIRHGARLLKPVPARKKLVLLISDGKPTDYDRYEGRYGIEDIRQSIRECTRDQIAVRSLAIEASAKFYLPQMFGTGNFQILPHPGKLANALADLYGWLSG